jgi:hypothetical protein
MTSPTYHEILIDHPQLAVQASGSSHYISARNTSELTNENANDRSAIELLPKPKLTLMLDVHSRAIVSWVIS